ncbi:MAG: DNA cytosine methyltransferase [Candidatus Saccharibacteria bacterium]|nr:DNA cytosine methyltransferase [Candidatus Saccharibacteria bacterium]
MNKLTTFADFCAGIGGFRIAAEQHGLQCVATSEINDDCIATYNENFGASEKISDVTSLDQTKLPDFDLLCAGFPCQPYSIAGKKLGLLDDRSGVLQKLIQIVSLKKPKALLLENVENFKSFQDGTLLASTLKEITALGYAVFSGVLDSAKFGVPQQRRRLFIVAFRNDLAVKNFHFPHGDKTTSPFRNFIASNDFSIPISKKWEQYIDLYSGSKRLDELDFLPPKTRLSLERADIGLDLTDCIFQMRSSGIRALSIDKPLPTFAVSISGGGAMIPVYSKERRHLNLTEMKRLMGFPDDFKFPVSRTSAVKQLANAVTPPVIHSIINQMILAMRHEDNAEPDHQYSLELAQ